VFGNIDDGHGITDGLGLFGGVFLALAAHLVAVPDFAKATSGKPALGMLVRRSFSEGGCWVMAAMKSHGVKTSKPFDRLRVPSEVEGLRWIFGFMAERYSTEPSGLDLFGAPTCIFSTENAGGSGSGCNK
jgi:hypothetical protein